MKSSKSRTMPANRKQNACTRCGRPSRGHIGPQGRGCNMIIESSEFPQPDFSSSVREPVHTTWGSGRDPVLAELTNQMGLMSVHMQQMQQDMTAMKVNSEKAGVSAAAVSAGAGVASIVSLKSPVNSDESKGDNYECLSSGAKVTAKVLKSAKSGECVNLVDFAPVLEPSNVTETSLVDGELTFKQKRVVKSIDSFLLWSLAWQGGYEEHLVEGDPSLYKKLVDYRIFIQTCAAKYCWQSVYAYDVRNRSKHSMYRSFNFSHVDSDIYVTCMDSSTMRTNVKQCARCRSIWHVTRDCPFPACNEVETGPRSLASQASNKP
jgi:hypothetical protein